MRLTTILRIISRICFWSFMLVFACMAIFGGEFSVGDGQFYLHINFESFTTLINKLKS